MQDTWLSNKADEMQSYADKHDTNKFYARLKAVNGPQSSEPPPSQLDWNHYSNQ